MSHKEAREHLSVGGHPSCGAFARCGKARKSMKLGSGRSGRRTCFACLRRGQHAAVMMPFADQRHCSQATTIISGSSLAVASEACSNRLRKSQVQASESCNLEQEDVFGAGFVVLAQTLNKNSRIKVTDLWGSGKVSS